MQIEEPPNGVSSTTTSSLTPGCLLLDALRGYEGGGGNSVNIRERKMRVLVGREVVRNAFLRVTGHPDRDDTRRFPSSSLMSSSPSIQENLQACTEPL